MGCESTCVDVQCAGPLAHPRTGSPTPILIPASSFQPFPEFPATTTTHTQPPSRVGDWGMAEARRGWAGRLTKKIGGEIV